ncbi:MAG TPA: cyclic dehypoxanthinyl futalosine synthase [Candidatus Deferrimicrobiaceae bacterium]|nr:cyclic dehypoxanthinyl futalosine synthase [Candidatus Deferrimicrobiaceae bacterium]
MTTSPSWRDALGRAEEGRATVEDAESLLRNAPLFDLGRSADGLRKRIHPDDVVTYIVDRNVNYTNICSCRCSFCAFYREKGAPDAYVLSDGELSRKIEETLEAGGTQILLQGGLHPDWGLPEAVRLTSAVKRHPIRLHGFSPPEIWHFANRSGVSIAEAISRLKEAGLDSIPGGGAEILDDTVRGLISPRKISWRQWVAVMREAHRQGLPTSATMMFGSVEAPVHIARHLARVRELQEETGGFTSFIPWTFQPGNTLLSRDPRFGDRNASGLGHAVGYLRLLAVSRLLLPPIRPVQVSWVTRGAKVAQLGLFFGGNDYGSTMMEENVVASAGVAFRMSEEEIVATIRDAGFHPRRREEHRCSI